MPDNLYEAFNHYFETVHADTDDLRRHVYALRYQVYVVETAFEHDSNCECGLDENGRAIHLEKDEYDARSDHFLIRHRRTGAFAATVRLVLPEPGKPLADYPIEHHCLDINKFTSLEERAKLAEISRYAVSKEFKKRIGEMGSLAGVSPNEGVYFEEDERRVLPHISLGLIATIIRMSKANNIEYLYAVMEPALSRLLTRFGIVFERIGPDVNYHGVRVPCRITLESLMTGVERTSPPVWDLMTGVGGWAPAPNARPISG